MKSHYSKLALAISLNAIVMYFITYALIDSLDHFYFNINRLYMTVMMVAPMVIVMLIVMSSMFESRRRNVLILVGAVGALVVAFALARNQAPVHEKQFLRSMIPHHSSAIVMCERATLTDPQLIRLCDEIVQTQKDEIAQMKGMLKRY